MTAASERPGWVVAVAALALAMTACGDVDPVAESETEDPSQTGTASASTDDTDAADDTGQVSMRFEVSSTVTGSVNLVDELTGSIYGDLFLSADVSTIGPSDDAERFGAVEIHDVDLTGEDAVTEVLWTSDPLPPGDYTFLGFFDVDVSSLGSDEFEPESGDPVTLPTVNKFTITADETVELVVRFDLVLS